MSSDLAAHGYCFDVCLPTCCQTIASVSPSLVAGWSEQEAAAFEAGLDAHGRRFDLVHAHMLPHRSERELVSFFYDVWKTRSTPRARAWHARKKEVRNLLMGGSAGQHRSQQLLGSHETQCDCRPQQGSSLAHVPEGDLLLDLSLICLGLAPGT